MRYDNRRQGVIGYAIWRDTYVLEAWSVLMMLYLTTIDFMQIYMLLIIIQILSRELLFCLVSLIVTDNSPAFW